MESCIALALEKLCGEPCGFPSTDKFIYRFLQLRFPPLWVVGLSPHSVFVTQAQEGQGWLFPTFSFWRQKPTLNTPKEECFLAPPRSCWYLMASGREPCSDFLMGRGLAHSSTFLAIQLQLSSCDTLLAPETMNRPLSYIPLSTVDLVLLIPAHRDFWVLL